MALNQPFQDLLERCFTLTFILKSAALYTDAMALVHEGLLMVWEYEGAGAWFVITKYGLHEATS
jgi:hypothetical protein